MTTTPKAVTIPTVSWSDPASVTSYVTSIITVIIAVITAVHPGFTEPSIVPTLVPAISLLVAGGVQVANVITHRSLQKAIINKSS